eukprot:6206961-Amphidinium_carterae.1
MSERTPSVFSKILLSTNTLLCAKPACKMTIVTRVGLFICIPSTHLVASTQKASSYRQCRGCLSSQESAHGQP